jgi:hypothetical protein
MMRIVLSVAVIALLAACAPSDPGTLPTLAPTVPSDEGAAPTEETTDNGGGAEDDITLGAGGDGLFSATLDGALDQVLAGPGSFTCEGGQHVLGVTVGVDVLTFTLPPDTAPGEYSIGADDTGITSYLEVGGTAYTDDVFGILTLAVVPAAAGEAVSGSFDMNYIAGDATVNAVGNFDLLADDTCG